MVVRKQVADEHARTPSTGAAGARGARLQPPPYGLACVDDARGAGDRVIARQLADDAQCIEQPLECAPVLPPVFSTEHAGGVSVALGQGESLFTLARKHYGRGEKKFVELIQTANGLTDRDLSRMRPGRGIVIPPVRRPVARPTPTVEDPADAFTVPLGQATFESEGEEAPGTAVHTRVLHWPGGESGVTIGRGYDMGNRSAKQIRGELTAAGVPAATAATLSQAAGLKHEDARTFRRQHRNIELTPAAQWNLYNQEYLRIADAAQVDITVRELSRPPEERIDPATLDRVTAQFLVDLRFRGDLDGAWPKLRPHLRDPAALAEVVRTRSNFPGWPPERYKHRCRMLGVEPEALDAPTVQRALAGPDHLAGAPAPGLVRAALAAPSSPLSPALRERMQSQLGHDFGHVRVHTGALADASARAVGAVAYTVGEHVVFRARAFAPDTTEGQQTLAHELVHVTQQAPLAGATASNLVVGDPHSAHEHAAERLAARDPSTTSTAATLQRQKADETPTTPATDTATTRLLLRASQLAGLPYGFSEADTVKDITAKLAALDKQLRELPKPAAAASQADKDLHAARIKQLKADIAAATANLQVARDQYAPDEKVGAALKEHGGPELTPELKEALHQYGVVCNTFIEVMMRTSGFTEFPLTGREYLPQSKQFTALEQDVNKKLGHKRMGWGLQWAERIADWGAAHDALVYDESDPARSTLPAVQAGDIVIFRRQDEGYHASVVVSFGDGFNFFGARSSGKKSGTSLTSPFKTYGDEMATRKGKQPVPVVMGQKKYLWIVRPSLAAAPPPEPPTTE